MGASSRRRRHHFPALMAGGQTLALCLCTGPYQHHASPKQHTRKSITMSMNCNCGISMVRRTRMIPDLNGQILSTQKLAPTTCQPTDLEKQPKGSRSPAELRPGNQPCQSKHRSQLPRSRAMRGHDLREFPNMNHGEGERYGRTKDGPITALTTTKSAYDFLIPSLPQKNPLPKSS